MYKNTVYVIDDDAGFSASLVALFHSVDILVESFQDPYLFLDLSELKRPTCVILDVRLPGIYGLEVMERIQQKGWSSPVLMMSGHGDVPMAMRAMHLGAVDFLEKPMNESILIQLVQNSIVKDANRFQCERLCDSIRGRMALLTERELGVLRCLILGLQNKAAAIQMNLSVKAIEGHRANLFQKMGCASSTELIKLVSNCPKFSTSPLNCNRKFGKICP
jgi:FixJ family two-component response regulator